MRKFRTVAEGREEAFYEAGNLPSEVNSIDMIEILMQRDHNIEKEQNECLVAWSVMLPLQQSLSLTYLAASPLKQALLGRKATAISGRHIFFRSQDPGAMAQAVGLGVVG